MSMTAAPVICINDAYGVCVGENLLTALQLIYGAEDRRSRVSWEKWNSKILLTLFFPEIKVVFWGLSRFSILIQMIFIEFMPVFLRYKTRLRITMIEHFVGALQNIKMLIMKN